MRYGIQSYPNPEIFEVHLEGKLPSIPFSVIRKDLEDGDARALQESLLSINGVEEVSTSMGLHRLRVKRCGVFSIDELIPEILAVLAPCLQAASFERVDLYPPYSCWEDAKTLPILEGDPTGE